MEGPPPLSGTLTYLRSKARRDNRTQTYYDDEGYETHALSHRKPGLCHGHPAYRGNVQGLVDHEAKVVAAFIGSAKK